jgi:hypothetical protein
MTGDARLQAAAVADLQRIAAGRSDLLAKVAGLTWGYHRQSAVADAWPPHERAVLLLLDGR